MAIIEGAKYRAFAGWVPLDRTQSAKYSRALRLVTGKKPETMLSTLRVPLGVGGRGKVCVSAFLR